MPLKVCNAGNIQVDIVSRLERKVGRSLDHQIDHLGGQHHPSHHIGLALFCPRLTQTYHLLTGEHTSWSYEPLPEVGCMKHRQNPENNVQEMGPVKHLRKQMNKIESP